MSIYEMHFRRYLSEIEPMSVYEFLSVDIYIKIDAKTLILGQYGVARRVVLDCSTGYRLFLTSISTQDVDIDFDIGWQKGLFWIIVPDIDVFYVGIETKHRCRVSCDNNIE
jgi:hypothetical protein